MRNNHSLIKTLIFEIWEKIKSAPSKKQINILLHSEFGHLLLDIWCKGCSLQYYTTFPISFLAGNAIRRPHLCQNYKKKQSHLCQNLKKKKQLHLCQIKNTKNWQWRQCWHCWQCWHYWHCCHCWNYILILLKQSETIPSSNWSKLKNAN